MFLRLRTTQLGVDLKWRLPLLSDGQRRRVHLLLTLLRPFQLLLLDEVTTSLDVCVRLDLLAWLKLEQARTGCTVIYATHIFDGLKDWPTHLVYINERGVIDYAGRAEDVPREGGSGEACITCGIKKERDLLDIVHGWLRAELMRKKAAGKLEKEAGDNYTPDPTDRQGGYASGRGLDMSKVYDLSGFGGQKGRQGRLSDIYGNAGAILKHA